VADRLARTLSADGTVRGLAAVTTELVEEARVRHGTLPTATAALGRALTAGLLLGGLSKADERVSLQFSGDGPLGSILVDATPAGHVRGFVSRPQTHLPARAGKLDVGGAVGRGVLCVMRIPLGEASPYRSIVPLVSGEIGTDVASYLAGSEQIDGKDRESVLRHEAGVGVVVIVERRNIPVAMVVRGAMDQHLQGATPMRTVSLPIEIPHHRVVVAVAQRDREDDTVDGDLAERDARQEDQKRGQQYDAPET